MWSPNRGEVSKWKQPTYFYRTNFVWLRCGRTLADEVWRRMGNCKRSRRRDITTLVKPHKCHFQFPNNVNFFFLDSWIFGAQLPFLPIELSKHGIAITILFGWQICWTEIDRLNNDFGHIIFEPPVTALQTHFHSAPLLGLCWSIHLHKDKYYHLCQHDHSQNLQTLLGFKLKHVE